jgi:dTDP-4-dehydrorhamnose 3,5-epimerase
VKFTATKIPGVVVVEAEPIGDSRGFFARNFCAREFAAAGLEMKVAQANLSHNAGTGTLRGMHYQAEPRPEPKLVSCIRGAVFDVAIDLRVESPTFCDWVGVELTAANGKALFVPPGCAHGFLTLADETKVSYLMGEFYAPDLASGVRWDDPAFGVDWPGKPAVISERDAGYPDFRA